MSTWSKYQHRIRYFIRLITNLFPKSYTYKTIGLILQVWPFFDGEEVKRRLRKQPTHDLENFDEHSNKGREKFLPKVPVETEIVEECQSRIQSDDFMATFEIFDSLLQFCQHHRFVQVDFWTDASFKANVRHMASKFNFLEINTRGNGKG